MLSVGKYWMKSWKNTEWNTGCSISAKLSFMRILPRSSIQYLKKSARLRYWDYWKPENSFGAKIKDAIVELVFSENNISVKASIYISEKLNHSYGYLSNLFSEITYTSIENFIIIQKIEYAKELMISNKYSLTEISLRLNYSSVAHLSSQFKNITGLTPSLFLKMISKRKNLKEKEVELSTRNLVWIKSFWMSHY